MNKRENILLICGFSILIIYVVFSVFQTSPDGYFRQYTLAVRVRHYVVENKQKRIQDLMDIPEIKKFLQPCGKDAKPTKGKDLVIYNPDYYGKVEPTWVLIIKGTKIHSRMKGYFVLWSNERITEEKELSKLIQKEKGLKYYYYEWK